MWFKDACAVSDGINCYPVSTPTNNYNNWGPIRDLEVILQLPNDRAILATYQLSTEMSSTGHTITGHGAMVNLYRRGIHYYFNVLYRSPMTFSFTDCQHDYRDNKNLHAMMLPPSCRVTTTNPRTTLSLLKTNTWLDTDLILYHYLITPCHYCLPVFWSGCS